MSKTGGAPRPQESVRCSGCGGALPLEALDRATWTVRCAACGRVEDLARLRPSADAGATVPLPAGVRRREFPGGVELSWRAFPGSRAAVLLSFLPVSLILAAPWLFMKDTEPLAGTLRWIMTSIWSLAFYMLVLVGMFTRVVIRMDGSGVAVRSRPFPVGRSVFVSADRIAAVHRGGWGFGPMESSGLVVELTDGHGVGLVPSRSVVGGVPTEAYVQACISSRFGLAIPTPGTAERGSRGKAAAPGRMSDCPSCGGALDWDALDRRTWSIRCPYCGVTSDATALRGSEEAAAMPATDLPPGVAERKVPGGFRLAWHPIPMGQRVMRVIVLALPISACVAVALNFAPPASFMFGLIGLVIFFFVWLPTFFPRYLNLDGEALTTGMPGVPWFGYRRFPRGAFVRADVQPSVWPKLLNVVVLDRLNGRETLLWGIHVPGGAAGAHYFARRINDALSRSRAG